MQQTSERKPLILREKSDKPSEDFWHQFRWACAIGLGILIIGWIVQ